MKYLTIFCVFLALLIEGKSKPASAAPQFDTAYDIINGVNAVRASYGLPALEVNNNLMAAAQGHSDYQASIGQGTHTGEGGTAPGDRAKASGYGGGAAISVTENIFSGSGATALIAVNWWVDDPIHLQTLIGPYKHIGAGMAVKNSVTYFTLVVGYLSSDPGTGADLPPGTDSEAPVAVATPREDGSIIHVVGFGQTLWSIAILYGITVEELFVLNNLTESSVIFPGDELIIQLPTTGPTFTPSGPTSTSAPTTPTITPTPTTRPTRTPRPTRTLAPTDNNAAAQVIPTSSPSSSQTEGPAQPSLRRLAPALIVVLLLVAGGLVWMGNIFDRGKEKAEK